MIGLAPILLIAIIVAIVYALRAVRARVGPSAPQARLPAPGAPAQTVTSSAEVGLARDLARWTEAGLITEEQSAAILAHERAAGPAIVPPVPRVPGSPRRISVVAEALGYLGGMLASIGLVLLVAQYWPDMPTAGRLALSGGAGAAFLASGALVNEQADAALARLRGFLWLASAAAAALFAGVATVDGFGVDRKETVVLACAGMVALHSGLLWRWRDRPVQQLSLLGALPVFAGAFAAEFAGSGPVGLTVWVVSAAFVVLGLQARTPLPLLTTGVGAIAVVVGADITAAEWRAFGWLFAVATAFGLLALAFARGLRLTKASQLLIAIIGAVALLQATPNSLSYFARDAGVATGLVTWAMGAALIFIGVRSLVRVPILSESLGGVAMIGGAALTGAQWHGFAPVFGIATAVALVALGMIPGQVLLSVFGSFGLLVNVPWAIGWFFPGEGRAPLLILVSGAVILAVAVALTRMAGRFRRELGGPRRRTPKSRILHHGT